MVLRDITLNKYRNFDEKHVVLSPSITVIVGPNASGKTNILEAINLLSTGKSFRANVESEMINYTEEVGRVSGTLLLDDEQEEKLEVVLTHGKIKVSEDPERFEKVAKKRLLVNSVGKRLFDFAGRIRSVLFAPQDMDLVTESPSIRRKFLDSLLSQIDRDYYRSLISYEKGLRQRNKLLFKIREEGLSRSQLLFWNSLLIKNGDYISRKREEFVDFANDMDDTNFTSDFALVYDKSAISEERLEKYKNEEIASATTLVGPHRDDIIFKIRNPKSETRNLDAFGSRGEQRMGVLWAKMAGLIFMEEKTGEKVMLLLDDIFSELDHKHRDVVMDVVKNRQTVITTADPHYINDLGIGDMEKIVLK